MVQAIPDDPLPPSAGRDIVLFYILFAISFPFLILVIICSLRAGISQISSSAKRKNGDIASVLLLPCLSLVLAYDSLSIAIAATADQWPVASAAVDNASAISNVVPSTVIAGVLKVRAAFQAFLIPLFLVTMFELNYEVHKRRNANFFFGLIHFDQGRRSTSSVIGSFVRYSVWLLALAILILYILINAPYMTDPTIMLETSRFGSKRLAIYTTVGGHIDWTDAMDFFPYCVLLGFSFYTGASLWRYGTTISTDVRATAINPWMSIFVATSGLTVAWVLTPESWLMPYAMNGMEVALLLAIAVTLGLVERNLRTLDEWDATLEAVNEAVFAAMAQNAKMRELQELAKVRAKRKQQQQLLQQQMMQATADSSQHPTASVNRDRKDSASSAVSEASVHIGIADSDSDADTAGIGAQSSTQSVASETSTVTPTRQHFNEEAGRKRSQSGTLVEEAVALAVHEAAAQQDGDGGRTPSSAAVAETMQMMTGVAPVRPRASLARPVVAEAPGQSPNSIGRLSGLLTGKQNTATPDHWLLQESQWRAQLQQLRANSSTDLQRMATEASSEESVASRTRGKASIPLWSRTLKEVSGPTETDKEDVTVPKQKTPRTQTARSVKDSSTTAVASPLTDSLAAYKSPAIHPPPQKDLQQTAPSSPAR